MLVLGYDITAKRLPREEVKWNEDWKAGFWIGYLVGSAAMTVIALLIVFRL